MDNMKTLHQLALEAAQALKEEWQVGESNRFCDDPPEWDDAEDQDIADKLLPFFEEALKRGSPGG